MKLVLKIFLVVVLAGLAGCATAARQAHYAKLAEEHPFDYFFPSAAFRKNFSSIDEAYEFVNTADRKFAETVSHRRRDKILGARLTGPAPDDEAPVVLLCLINAQNTEGNIDFTQIQGSIDGVLRSAVDARISFFILYNGKGASVSSFYIDPATAGLPVGDYMTPSFTLFGNTYPADFPVGWDIENVFEYLRGERE